MAALLSPSGRGRVAAALRTTTLLAAIGTCAVVVACDDAPAPPVSVCGDVAPRIAAATAPDRRLFGLASAYPADGVVAARTEELLTSQRARRAAAWEAVARVLAPVELAAPTAVEPATVPRFRTWYDGEDFTRVFQHAYEALGAEGRTARAPLSDTLLDEAFLWNPRALDAAPEWTDDRFAAYVARIRDGLDVAAVGGLQRITMSPEATRHVAESYPEILRCVNDGKPPAIVETRGEAVQGLARERIALDRCGQRQLGPFYVADGARLAARFAGSGGELAQLRVRAGATLLEGVVRCSGSADQSCEVAGPGTFSVELAAADVGVSGVLEVDAVTRDAIVPGCLRGVFPLGSASVAQEWRRVEVGPLPTYDTSGSALAARLTAGPAATWGDGDGVAEPGADAIYTLRIPSGATFRLAGLHIRTRELEHYLNITLWWSPNPDENFGADRPASIRALGGPWSHYAMCVAIDALERDPDASGGFGSDAPSLADALTAANDGGASWCSNPYIDAAPGLVQTNCVGCHQHAMSGTAPGEVVMDPVAFPQNGRLFVRNNFPGDQFWGLDAGDDLAVTIAEAVAYWDSAAP